MCFLFDIKTSRFLVNKKTFIFSRGCSVLITLVAFAGLSTMQLTGRLKIHLLNFCMMVMTVI